MTNEFELRDTARELKHHYLQLHALKHTTPNPPEVKTRNVVKGLGPKSPGNWLWVNRYVDMEQNLRELCLNAFGIDGIGIRIHDGDLSAPPPMPPHRMARTTTIRTHMGTRPPTGARRPGPNHQPLDQPTTNTPHTHKASTIIPAATHSRTHSQSSNSSNRQEDRPKAGNLSWSRRTHHHTPRHPRQHLLQPRRSHQPHKQNKPMTHYPQLCYASH